MGKRRYKTKIRLNKKNIIILSIIAVLIIAILVTLTINNGLPDLFKGHSEDKQTVSVLSGGNSIKLPDEFDINTLLEVHFIDIGQGDAIVIMLPDGKICLIDAGSGIKASKENREKYNDYLSRVLLLDKAEYMVVTHSDSDHVNLMEEVLDSFDVDNVYFNNVSKDLSKVYENFCAKARTEENAKVVEIVTPDDSLYIIENNNYKLTIFSSGNDGFSKASGIKNSMSIICLLEYGVRKVLFTGDAEIQTEEWFIDYAEKEGYDIDIDVLKVAHHGSDTSSSTLFLDAVKPEYAVISCGLNNSYNHPSKTVMDRLTERNTATYRTDKHGSVVLYMDYDGDFGFLPQNNLPAENIVTSANSRAIVLG
ncbi:MBL fold metallo-hydrolase [bacterium]|nr:MBL fold metallo-hydrolase [bacterium]